MVSIFVNLKMVSATECRVETSEYKKNFYIDGQKLFCEFCQHVVDHTRKSTVDNHLRSDKHKSNVAKVEKLIDAELEDEKNLTLSK